jgi:hypothetical protein
MHAKQEHGEFECARTSNHLTSGLHFFFCGRGGDPGGKDLHICMREKVNHYKCLPSK